MKMVKIKKGPSINLVEKDTRRFPDLFEADVGDSVLIKARAEIIRKENAKGILPEDKKTEEVGYSVSLRILEMGCEVEKDEEDEIQAYYDEKDRKDIVKHL